MMEVVKEGPRSALRPGQMVALAAGLSVGAAAVGYIVYRAVNSSRESLPFPSSFPRGRGSISTPYLPAHLHYVPDPSFTHSGKVCRPRSHAKETVGMSDPFN